MKINKFSLKKKWFLLSLSLLAPGILAAENLNFNYTNAGALSLEPRIGLQAKACHSLSEPLKIKVLFGEMNSKYMNVRMTVYGKKVSKSYAASGAELRRVTPDPDLTVPWVVSIKGSSTVDITKNVTTPEMVDYYDDPFCFSRSVHSLAGAWNYLNNYLPIFDNPPYSYVESQAYQKYCFGFTHENLPHVGDGYWPDLNNPPENIREGLKKPFNEYQGKYIFYRHKYSAESGGNVTSKINEIEELIADAAGGSDAVPGVVYDFPITKKNSVVSNLNGGDFVVTLDNRNVTSLKLDITHEVPGFEPDHVTFSWERDNKYLNNVLAFKGSVLQLKLDSAGDIDNDPYSKSLFYAPDVAAGYFKGTLVAENFLTKAYTDYNKIMPLSLPPAKQGDINLVNTESLTFKIGMSNGKIGGDPTLTIYGQPLKFGPLYSGGKEVLSAMQVRNACY